MSCIGWEESVVVIVVRHGSLSGLAFLVVVRAVPRRSCYFEWVVQMRFRSSTFVAEL